MPRTDPRIDNRPENPSRIRSLRLRLGEDGARWSQRHLSAYITKHPIPDVEGKSVAWLRKMESGEIAGDTRDALQKYLEGMIAREATAEKIPRPKLLEKTPRRG